MQSSIFVISAPSGTGKTTLNRRLVRENFDQVEMTVSYTARPRRASEVDGKDYNFVSPADFKRRVENGEMLEYAEVFGILYGTPFQEIERIQNLGKKAIVEIDVQGWQKARNQLPQATSIFVLPPSVEVLWQRLENRGTEPENVRWRRLMTAKNEISAGPIYDYFVINAALEPALLELYNIIIMGEKGKIGNAEGASLCRQLLGEFDDAPWMRKLSEKIADR